MFYYCLVPCAGPSQPSRRCGAGWPPRTQSSSPDPQAGPFTWSLPCPLPGPSAQPHLLSPTGGQSGLFFMLLFHLCALGVELFGKLSVDAEAGLGVGYVEQVW